MSQINEFHVFIAVAEKGSFSAASRALHLSPSAVSKLISRIEDRVCVRLFDRSSKSAILTHEGQAYLQGVQKVIDAVADVESLADSLVKVPSGTLRIHTMPSFAQGQVAPLLPEFMALYPDLCIEFRIGLKFVGLADDMDIAIQFGALPDSTLVQRKLATSRRILCASPAYLEQHGTPAEPHGILNHVLLNYTMPGRETWPFRHNGKMFSIPIQAKIAVDQAAVLQDLARSGLGITRLPEFNLMEDFAAGRLVPLLTEFCVNEPICAVVRARRNLSPRMRVFLDFIEQKLQSKPWNLDRKL